VHHLTTGLAAPAILRFSEILVLAMKNRRAIEEIVVRRIVPAFSGRSDIHSCGIASEVFEERLLGDIATELPVNGAVHSDQPAEGIPAVWAHRTRQGAVNLIIDSPPEPVCGLEDELEGNLESFACLRGIEYEVLLSVADENDPAIAVVRDVMRRFPRAPFRLIIGGDPRLESSNRKVARLIAAAPHARGEIFFISDANVRIEPGDIAATVAVFDDTRVGCVSNLFTGAGAASFGASMESLHLLSFVVPGNVLAHFAGVPCVVGKSMAISRGALRAIGGFEKFAGVLAEDQAIALAVQRAGFEVALSPLVVRNIVVQRTLRRALDRQIRWNKIRYAFSKCTYSAEFVLNPLPFALLAAIAGGAPLLPLFIVILRMAQLSLLALSTGAPMRARDLLFAPLLDVLQFGAQLVPYFDNRVTWRGYTARLGPNTVLVDVAEAAA
jgi:ceramide glucosyltransferase